MLEFLLKSLNKKIKNKIPHIKHKRSLYNGLIYESNEIIVDDRCIVEILVDEKSNIRLIIGNAQEEIIFTKYYETSNPEFPNNLISSISDFV